MKTSLRLGVVMMLTALLAAPAVAQMQLLDTSTLVITEPTDIGGTILQPGTYTLTLYTGQPDRNVVRVLDADNELITTVLTVPHPLEPSEVIPDTRFVYFPAIEGEPRVLMTWFPANTPSGIGHDIVFGEERARLLATRAESRVVFYPDTVETVEIDEDIDLQVITPEDEVTTYVVTEPIAEIDMDEDRAVLGAAEELPATGSRTPLIALLGLVSLVSAFAIRMAIR
ncbi:MAG: LPXTG cell wall anchor domain-containing protein [Thermoanaerobaculia bacterium]